ncbi:MAG TPA: TIGR00269 family protein [Candidatus Methanoperedenaceae archaeon]|nr:TIGR00269 family protein [Candidatus Methanoperedenaceae archaeon]
MKCDRCGSAAIIYQKYSGAHLCSRHFREDVERKIKRDIRKRGMVRRGDRVAIALSGGKDSTVLTHVLHKIFSAREDIELMAVTIDEGISGYRERTLSLAAGLTKSLGIPHVVRTFRDEFGRSLDEMIAEKRGGACTVCGVLRKKLLNKTARELGAQRLATGHNLDDEAQTVLMNYLRGDINWMARLAPEGEEEDMVPRIKPLRSVPEKEVALYALTNELPMSLDECQYAHAALRNEAREFVNSYEVRHPGTKYSIVNGFDRLMSAVMPPSSLLMKCRLCGEPTSRQVCRACRLLGYR